MESNRLRSVVIRTFGGIGIGYGHFFRCYSFAKAMIFQNPNIKITFLVNRELTSQLTNSIFCVIVNDNLNKDIDIIQKVNPDLVIWDSYLGDNKLLENIKQLSNLLLIDDNNDIYNSAIPDIVVNGNLHAGKLVYRKRKDGLYLLGPEYLIMKEEYWKNEEKKNNDKEGILITTGGTDKNEVSYDILKSLTKFNYKIKVVIGPGYEEKLIKKLENIKNDNTTEFLYRPISLKKYINESKIVITAGGSTVYEVLSQKSIPIVFSIADNQDLICNELKNSGIVYIGKYPNINYDILKRSIVSYFSQNINNELNIINGNGAIRIVEELASRNILY